jgi:hypothetical protein
VSPAIDSSFIAWHVHVEAGENVAKYWLNPVELTMNDGFRSHELTKLRLLVIEHRIKLAEAWDAHFGR